MLNGWGGNLQNLGLYMAINSKGSSNSSKKQLVIIFFIVFLIDIVLLFLILLCHPIFNLIQYVINYITWLYIILVIFYLSSFIASPILCIYFSL
jgi:hypothetical protein